MECHHRFQVLGDLWGALSQADVSLDLLLYSRSECEERQHWLSHVIGRAYREGVLLDGAPSASSPSMRCRFATTPTPSRSAWIALLSRIRCAN